MDHFLENTISEPFERFFEDIMRFLPRLLGLILIILLGIVLAYILKIIVVRIFRAAGLDRRAERLGAGDVLLRAGIKEPFSELLSNFIFWLAVAVFIFFGLHSLEIPAMEEITARFMLYLPNIFVSALLVFFGYVLGNLFGRAALIASVNAGMKVSGLIGRGVKWAIFLLALTMVLEQLGIGEKAIIIAFGILFGGVIFALALAFGLGGQDMAREYIKKRLAPEEKDELKHL
jgi:hypothetical protein